MRFQERQKTKNYSDQQGSHQKASVRYLGYSRLSGLLQPGGGVVLTSSFSDSRDLTKLGRERRRECRKTIVFITKYNDFTLATTWPPFVVFREREQQSMNHFNLHAASKLKFLIFYVHTALSKIK